MLWFRAKGDRAAGFGVLYCLDLFDEKFHSVVDEKIDLLLHCAQGQDRLTGDRGAIEADDAKIVRKLAEPVEQMVQRDVRD